MFFINKNELLINERIRDKEVRLIDADGEMIGIVSREKALEVANQRNLDLVMIAPTSKPPVCKIMDHGKYVFDLAKKAKEIRKNQKVVSLKEVRLTPSIEDHDFNFKLKNAIKFLKGGDKVKVSVRFRGRELNYTSLGKELLDRFAEELSEFGSPDKRPKLEGKNMVMIINPKN